MICESPKHLARLNLSFELTFSNFNYETSNGLTFSYYDDLQINSVFPTYISLDAKTNSVLIDIYGWGFLNTSSLSVRVDN